MAGISVRVNSGFWDAQVYAQPMHNAYAKQKTRIEVLTGRFERLITTV